MLDLPNLYFMGKKDLSSRPLRWLMTPARKPYPATKGKSLIRKAVRSFANENEFMLAISPEGTRQKVNRLDTSFYFIAKKARVPVIMIGLDYASKKVVISDPLYTSDDKEEDFNRVHSFFSSIRGYYPEKGLQHFKATSGIIYSFKRSLWRQ
jgi:1-acyl-sn-glycerol-3-phosphate acyltransferase